MNILFIGKRSNQETPGVNNKLDAQMDAFRALGHTVSYTDMSQEGCFLYAPGGRFFLRPFRSWGHPGINFYLNNALMLLATAKKSPLSFDMCYIRKPVCDPVYIAALKALRRRGTRIIEEIPTYPYDAELKGQRAFAASLFLVMDRLFRRRAHRFIDGIATYSQHTSIFNLPAIPIQNGIHASSLPLHRPQQGPPGTLRLIAVSTMAPWHGYDRLIRGMAAYQTTAAAPRRITLCLVGEGPQKGHWQQLAAELGLADSVRFPGTVTGQALDFLFNQNDLAIASLANFRKGLYAGAELKTREYIARGIPFIYTMQDSAAEAAAPYSLRIPADESDVDVGCVLRFYEDLPQNCAQTLRQYALQNLQWETQLQKVLDFYTALPPANQQHFAARR